MLEFQELIRDYEWITLFVFAFIALVLIIYYSLFFARVAFGKNQYDTPGHSPPVSVVICARNEYDNLKNNVPLLMEQDYPEYEVIIVNDFSQDETSYLLQEYQKLYSNLRVINLRENVNFFEGKKLALALGIKAANHEVVLLTDADCTPAGKDWIRLMGGLFSDKTEIVLGYGAYKKHRGFLNSLIRFDTLHILLQYMGFAMAHVPYMGVGRNLAYKKQLFFKSGGFTSHYKINSGDDDLFINKVANKKNTKVQLQPASFTISEPKKTFSSWFKQKKRHLSTGKYYKFKHKVLLGIYSLSTILFYISFAVFLYFQQTYLTLYFSLGILFLKIAYFAIIIYFAGKKTNDKKLYALSPVFDLFFTLLNPIFALSNLFYKKNKWK